MTPWLDAVAEFGRRAWLAHIDWLLVGSAASAMQGAAVEPQDVDVLVRRPIDVALLSGHLHDLAAPTASDRDPDTFLSSVREPLLWYQRHGWSWTFGRWLWRGLRVEVAHLDGPTDTLAETWGDHVWQVRRDVTASGVTAPCVPLEVQVATAIARGDEPRRRALTGALATLKHDRRLLAEALLGRGFRAHQVAGLDDVAPLLP